MSKRLSILQPWLEEIPLRMQSTLLLGLRGPDTNSTPNVKQICRWLRAYAFRPGNPDTILEFMYSDLPDRIVEKSHTAKELEFCTQHYYSHLMHALEVVAYRHPDVAIGIHAMLLYKDMCTLMHLSTESKGDFELRLCEREWPGGVQPDDGRHAVSLMYPDGPKRM